MRPRRTWLPAILLAATLASAPSTTLAAAIEVVDIRVGFDGRAKIGAWTPIRATLKAGQAGFEGTMEVVVDDESGTPTTASTAIRLAGGEPTAFVAYTRFGINRGGGTIRLVDAKGAVAATHDLAPSGTTNPAPPMLPSTTVILALGKPEGLDLITKLPGYNGEGTADFEVIRLDANDPANLPGRAIGYDAADVLVIDANDPKARAALAARGEAIRGWVAEGGHLVVAVGSSGQALRDGPLAPILPAELGGTTRINDVSTLETFAKATEPIVPDTVALTIGKLQGVETRGAKVLCAVSSSTIVARGPFGFGRVTLVALDTDGPPFSTWPDRNLFWVKALDLHPASSPGRAAIAGRFTARGQRDYAGVLRGSLEEFQGVQIVPFGWVAFFIFLYILLIGPGDYFFLKKILKRMELTWITFPAIVLLVSGLAYWAAYRAKGNQLRVNRVDVVDVDIPAKSARGATFLNVFSPANADYDVAIKPRSLRGDSAEPLPDADVRVSWFSGPEEGLRALGFGTAGYAYAPEGKADRLTGVRIPIWSTKAFSARWSAPIAGEPIVEADLHPNGADRLTGTITNRLDVPLKRAVLAFNTRAYYKLGDLAPGETKRVELTPDRSLSGHLRDLRDEVEGPPESAADPGRGAATRYALLQQVLFHDGEISGIDPIPSRPLHDLDLTGQLLLDRPILVAEVDRPATTLDLGPSAPIVAPGGDRTTVLRAILPLGAP